MQAPLRVVLFGPPCVTYLGAPVTVPRRRTRALLYRLASQLEPVSRDHLCFLFWPDTTDAQARRRLTLLLSQLRRALPEPDMLCTTPTQIQLDEARVWSDLRAFRACWTSHPVCSADEWRAAVDLPQGTLLDGISTAGMPEFDAWLQQERAWSERALLDMLASLVSRLMEQQDFLAASQFAQRQLVIEPLFESAHCSLMLCYAAMGNQAAVRRQYEACTTALAEQFGAEPQAETVELFRRLVGQAPATPAHAPPAHLPEDPATPRADLRPHSLPWPESAATYHLPHPMTPLIGRNRELETLARLLEDPDRRLTVMVGMGGMGKTHLALTAAQRAVGSTRFADGVCFVPLSAVVDPADVTWAILQALGLGPDAGDQPARDARRQLLDFLRGKRLLLVLDNFEHLVDPGGNGLAASSRGTGDEALQSHGRPGESADGAAVVADIVRRAPGVVVLATSRVPLGLYGEHRFPVDELAFPPDEETPDVADYGAVQMFVTCARRHDPRFALRDDNAAHIARICRLVAGMPLAIELAAAWVSGLSTAEIGREIAQSVGFLATDMRTMPERHRYLPALLDAIWQQMAPDDSMRFARLSVFRGGFTRQATGELFGVGMDDLRRFVAGSLIRYDANAGRYHIHELLRAHGTEQLSAHADAARAAQEQHGRYFCTLLATLEPELKGASQLGALATLTAELANVQKAWMWAVDQRDWSMLAPAMDGLGHLYAWLANPRPAILAFAAVTAVGDVRAEDARRVRAHACAWLAYFHWLSGDVDQAEEALRTSFSLLAALDAAGIECRLSRGLALLHQGHVARAGHLDAAADAYAASGALFTQIGRAWETACAWSWLGETIHLIGRHDEAYALLDQARTMFEALGDRRSQARALHSMADAYLLDRADLHVALATAQASLELRRQGNDQAGAAETLVLLAYIHCWLNQPEQAEPLLAEAFGRFRHLGHRHGECSAYYVDMVLANYQGDLVRKRASAERGLALARQLGDAKLTGDFLRGLANVYMAQGDFATAYAMHSEAVAVHEQAGIRALLPWLHVVRAYSSWRMAKLPEAREHLVDALRVTAAREDLYTAVHALLFVGQVLATAGNKARALELYTLAQRHSTWEGSLSGDRIFVAPLEALLHDMPLDVAARARARGLSLNLFDTVKHLSQEIAHAGWSWGDSDALPD